MLHDKCDILILGGGGAALYAAIKAHDANKNIKIIVASKGLLGKSGCTRMVQGGYNVVLNPEDSFDKHYDDTLRGGGLVNNQELAWTLVTEAPKRIIELENKFGCYFDRNIDGTIHQRALAGQSFNRTVHSGDLTGIEMMNRLLEQVLVRKIQIMSEVRGIDLLFNANKSRVSGALLLNFNSGELINVSASSTLLATGGAAPLYKFTPASLEKSGDGIAMGYRAGAELVDMEMMQFHPTGLIAGDSVMTGTVLEEGLRGAGGHLLNVDGERFMAKYDPTKMERSTRDKVSRSSYMEIRAGRGTSKGGVFLDVRHLGKEFLLKSSPGMYKRCLSVGYDMAKDPIQVTPTAHFQMGGLQIDNECRTSVLGLYAAGEDAGGVHGANRLGGNGVAESIVFGGVAGEAMVKHIGEGQHSNKQASNLQELLDELRPRKGNVNPFHLRNELGSMAWDSLGIIRSKDSLVFAEKELNKFEEKLSGVEIPTNYAGNSAFNEMLNLKNLISVAKLIEKSASLRTESRGSHYREDFPEISQSYYNIYLQKQSDGSITAEKKPVVFSRRTPDQLKGETVIPTSVSQSGNDSKRGLGKKI